MTTHAKSPLSLDQGLVLPGITSASALGTDSSGNVVPVTLPTITSFGVDGGSFTTNLPPATGTLKIDFGAFT